MAYVNKKMEVRPYRCSMIMPFCEPGHVEEAERLVKEETTWHSARYRAYRREQREQENKKHPKLPKGQTLKQYLEAGNKLGVSVRKKKD